ncbi:hypothetical protein IWQ60_007457 [Tieghemiomyces parasiticus]|uniref:Uncharacterized protein n=1 Tax=Tieghemiomyces parasiticus TaxID=78921 RepID=A0A9W8A353_9FUNG|nr:hypothetical protein IWQ60_007457 [Tieghemiomyces parasiticus]
MSSSTSGFTSCPKEIQLLIMNAADPLSMPRFLELSRQIRDLAIEDNCIRSALAHLRLSRAITYSTEYEALSPAEKDSVTDIFRFEFDLFSNYLPDQTDLQLIELRSKFTSQPIHTLIPHIQNYIEEAESMDKETGALVFSDLGLSQRFALSPMLSLASEGDVDTLLALRDRLVGYCETPEFLWAMSHRRTPSMAALRDAAVGSYHIADMYTCPFEGFMVADMAIVFTMASAGKFDELNTFLSSRPTLEVGMTTRPTVGDGNDGGEGPAVGEPTEMDRETDDRPNLGDHGEEIQSDDEDNMTAYLRRSALAFMLMSELGKEPMMYSHFRGHGNLFALLWRVLICAKDYGFNNAIGQATTIWNIEIQEPLPDNESEGCSDNYYGQKTIYDPKDNRLAFLVNAHIFNNRGVKGQVPFYTLQNPVSFNGNTVQLMRDMLTMYGWDN